MASRKSPKAIRFARRVKDAAPHNTGLSAETRSAPNPKAAPPKITAPRPARLYPRARLFDLLDRTRHNHRVIWVSAPGGAGKTSLATSYLAARKGPTLWYQVDAGDGDIASFFYYMGLAARRAAPRYRQPLPVLTPEYLAEVPTFTRNFFRELYRRLPPGTVIVLDNYQDAPEESMLHEVLHLAMGEIPDGLNLFVLSRVEPPAVLARLRLCDHAACLDWGKMQLTPEETAGLGALRAGGQPLDGHLVDTLQQRTHGWAAGVVLMLEQARDANALGAAPAPADQELLFHYFAGEVLHRSLPETQEFLLKTALFPKVTAAQAAALTGHAHARDILEDLTRRNYFTVRHLAQDHTYYEYHPLFREFLRERAGARFTPEQLATLQQQAARLLAAAGNAEAAMQLWTATGNWDEVVAALLASAPGWLAQGRWQTLVEWIERLPAPVRETDPGVAYWQGMALLPFDPPRSRDILSRAYSAFKLAGAVEPRWRAWCAVIDSFVFEWRDFHPLDAWIAEFESESAGSAGRVPAALDAHIAGGMFTALMNRRPQHPDMERWAQRVWDLVIGGTDPALRLKTGPHLLLYYTWWVGDLPKAEMLLDALRPYAEDPKAPPLVQTTWCAMAGAYYWMHADNAACIATVERGLALAEATGVHVWDTLLCSHGMFATLTSGQVEAARIYAKRMARSQDPARAMDTAAYHYLSSYLCYCEGNHAGALERLDAAVTTAEAAGAVYQTGIFRNDYGRLLFYAGDERGAQAHIAQALATSRAMRSPSMEYLCHLAQAEIAMQRGEDAACRTALTAGLRIGRAQGYRNHTFWDAGLMSRLYAHALAHGIEIDTTRAIIRQRRLTPPNGLLPEHWPWRLRLYTLGRFGLVKDEAPLKAEHKSSRKPLELLKALIAFGGREVPEQRLSEALWPGAEGDAAHQAFATTLHRLRKLLGMEEVLRLEGNQLTLDTRYVWIDAWAFERGLTQSASDGGASDEQILTLYDGPFLGGEELAFALPTRERLRSKFLRAVAEQGARYEQAADHDRAITCYHKGLEVDPLAEELYRRLMLCHRRLNRHAEALAVYQRCQQTLAAVLGVPPSPETQVLYKEILAAAR